MLLIRSTLLCQKCDILFYYLHLFHLFPLFFFLLFSFLICSFLIFFSPLSREHAMVAICNGMFAYGGIRPFCATFLNFIGYALGSVRVSALSQFGILFIMTHDSIGLGEGKRDTISHLDPSITASSCYSPPHHSVSSTQSHLLYTLASTISFYSFFLLLCPASFSLLPIFYPPNFIIFLPSSLVPASSLSISFLPSHYFSFLYIIFLSFFLFPFYASPSSFTHSILFAAFSILSCLAFPILSYFHFL